MKDLIVFVVAACAFFGALVYFTNKPVASHYEVGYCYSYSPEEFTTPIVVRVEEIGKTNYRYSYRLKNGEFYGSDSMRFSRFEDDFPSKVKLIGDLSNGCKEPKGK